MEQECIEKANLFGINSQWQIGIQIQRPHFDILDAFEGQCIQGPFIHRDNALRPNGAIELVLQLQQVGINLPIFAVAYPANLLVLRMGGAHRLVQTIDVGIQFVIADEKGFLCLALVTEIAHAQATCIE